MATISKEAALKKIAEAHQRDTANAIDYGFARAIHDAGITDEGVFNQLYKTAEEILSQQSKKK